jgi:hypothetical protein
MYFLFLWVCWMRAFLISGIIQHMTLWVWLLLLSIMISRFSHVVACILFLLMETVLYSFFSLSLLVLLGIELRTSACSTSWATHASSSFCFDNFGDRILLLPPFSSPPTWSGFQSYFTLSTIAGMTGTSHHIHLLFEMGLQTFLCLGWPRTSILPISDSQVARSTGVSHQCLASQLVVLQHTLSGI